MDFVDFLIGLSLIHALPHFILGVWNRRFPSPFGPGSTPNIMYSLLILSFSFILFIIKYGLAELMTQGIYLGAITTIVFYSIVGPILYKRIKSKK